MKRDSLSRLIARSLGLADVIQPVLPSRFEPIVPVLLPETADLGAAEAPESTDAAPPRIHPSLARPRNAVPPTSPKFQAVQTPRSETMEDVIRTRPFAAPLAEVSPPIEPRSVAVVSPAVPEKVQPPEETLRIKRQRPEPSVVTDKHDSLRLQMAQPSGTVPEAKRTARQISPAEIRVREPHPVAPSTGNEPQAQRVPGKTPDSPRQDGPGEQKVTVHIGRIEVRAVLTPSSEPAKKHPGEDRQRLTLSDYLKQREKGAK